MTIKHYTRGVVTLNLTALANVAFNSTRYQFSEAAIRARAIYSMHQRGKDRIPLDTSLLLRHCHHGAKHRALASGLLRCLVRQSEQFA